MFFPDKSFYIWHVFAETTKKEIHRILDSDMVGENKSVKVADFGLSTVLFVARYSCHCEILDLTVYHCIIGELFFTVVSEFEISFL